MFPTKCSTTRNCSPIRNTLFLFLASEEWPECWISEMAMEKQATYRWLLFKERHLGCKFCIEYPVPGIKHQKGVVYGSEWTNYKVGYSKTDPRDRELKPTAMHKKIALHKTSKAHITSEEIFH